MTRWSRSPRPAGTPASWRAVIARPTLAAVLALLGVTLAGASRVHPRLRAQITRSLVLEISTEDGVARHWFFDGPTRRVRTESGRHRDPDHALRFADSAQALRALISPSAVDRIIEELHAERVRVEGGMVMLAWFSALPATVLRLERPRSPLPGAYLAPDDRARGEEKIVVEPPVDELDPTWHAAWRSRARLGIVRAASGDPGDRP